MSVECKGSVTTIVDDCKDGSVSIIIWTIGDDRVSEQVDRALDRVFNISYQKLREEKVVQWQVEKKL